MIKHADIKQRFGILGNSPKLDRAIEVALQVAPTDISVLITGESGTGKEAMPKIIHHSSQKHGNYIAVTVGLFLKELSIVNYLDMKKALLQEPMTLEKGILK